MQTLTDVLNNRRFRIKRINRAKGYLILSVEGVYPCLYIPFHWIPAKTLFALTKDIDLSPDPPESCNEPRGDRYGRIHMRNNAADTIR